MFAIKTLYITVFCYVVCFMVVPLGERVVCEEHRASVRGGVVGIRAVWDVSVEKQYITRDTRYRREGHLCFCFRGDDALCGERDVRVVAPLTRTYLYE